MRDLVGDTGQIWLATHSISLLPFLKPGEVWVVDGGQVLPPSHEQVERAMQALVGTDENIERIREFLVEPAQAAAVDFLSQGLTAPSQSEYKDGDPQLFQAATVLRSCQSGTERLSILDFGAGRGRLAAALSRDCHGDWLHRVAYIAVEPQRPLHADIKQAAGHLLGDAPFTDIGALPSRYNEYFDVCIACNVLHEIRPTKWREQIQAVLQRLKPEGTLIIMEDQEMPKGEQPHELGFLVLGISELQTLFSLDQAPRTFVHPDPKYADRLACVEIPANRTTITSETAKRAITDLKNRLEGAIKEMRT
jgi:SAM-dependent methyltransferase